MRFPAAAILAAASLREDLLVLAWFDGGLGVVQIDARGTATVRLRVLIAVVVVLVAARPVERRTELRLVDPAGGVESVGVVPMHILPPAG